MIAPTFEPHGTPGDSLDTGFSWMERGQQARMRQQAIEREAIAQQEAIDQAPVRILKAEADRKSYEAGIQNAVIMEDYRRRAAIDAPQALTEFLEINKNADLDAKAAELDAFAARTAYLNIIPEYKAFHESVKNVQAKAHLDAIAMGRIAQMTEESKRKALTDEKQIAQKADAAALKATTDIQLKAKDDEIARMRDETTRRGQDTNAQIAKDRATQTASRPANAAAVKVNEAHLAAGEQAMNGIRDAERGIVLLDEARTGTAAQKQVAAQRLGQLFGVDTSTAEAEELQRILGDAVLKRVNQTKGAISDKEMALFDQYSASLTKSAEGNKAILSAYVAVLRREVQVAKMVNQGRQEGLSEREIQLEVNDFILNNPIDPTGGSGADPEMAKVQTRIEELKKIIEAQKKAKAAK